MFEHSRENGFGEFGNVFDNKTVAGGCPGDNVTKEIVLQHFVQLFDKITGRGHSVVIVLGSVIVVQQFGLRGGRSRGKGL